MARPSSAQQELDATRFVDQTQTHISTRWMEGFYPIYAAAQRTFGVNWLLLASIHRQESAFSTAPDTYHGLNFAGCCGGPMQFNVTNGPVTTWQLVSDSFRYGHRPGSYDHVTAKHPSIYDDFDSIMAAAHLLSADGAEYALDGAAWGAAYDYYGHDATGVTYADQVLARAIGWSQHGFCINCGVDPAMIEAVHAAYGAPVLAALTNASTARVRPLGLGGVGLRHQLAGDAVGRAAGAAEQAARELGAAEVQRGVVLPRGAGAAVHGDHRARGLVERAAGDRARGAGGERELGGPADAGPAGVVEQRAPVVELAQHLGERVLDGLVGADRAAEGVALLGVFDGHVERRFDAAERLGGDQRLREIPGRGERLLGRVEHDAPARRSSVTCPSERLAS